MNISRLMYVEASCTMTDRRLPPWEDGPYWRDLAVVLSSLHEFDAWRLWHYAITNLLEFEQLLELGAQMIALTTTRVGALFGKAIEELQSANSIALSKYNSSVLALSEAVGQLSSWHVDRDKAYREHYRTQDNIQLQTAQTIFRLPWRMPRWTSDESDQLLKLMCQALERFGVGPVGEDEVTISVPFPYAQCPTQVRLQFTPYGHGWQFCGDIPCPDVGVLEMWVVLPGQSQPDRLSYRGDVLEGLSDAGNLGPLMSRRELQHFFNTQVIYSSHPHKR